MLFSTSRKAGAKTRALARDLSYVIPRAAYLSRGKSSLEDVLDRARGHGHLLVGIIEESHGNPSMLHCIQCTDREWKRLAYCALSVHKLRKEFKSKKQRAALLKLEFSLPQFLAFFKKLGIASQADADLVAKESNNTISFFEDGKEVGPRVSLGAIHYVQG